jgi:UDP-glucose 4-epimerase
MAKNIPLKRFVFASSSSVYGLCPELPMKETSPLFPISPYGVTKLAGEKLCYLYHKNFDLPIVLLRYFTVYGPRQRPDMAFHKFMKSILFNEEIVIFGDGNQTRDFTYIDDVIDATIKAATNGKNGEVYNIGGGSRIRLNDVLNLLERITEKKIKIRRTEPQKGEMPHTLASIEKAKRDLSYLPQTKIEDGLLNEWEWIKNIYCTK